MFGILTLATPSDYRKAIGLALSIRVSNPSVQIAVACSPKLRSLLTPYFDYVIDEDASLKGFEHKVHLDKYSPFDDTFFFDSDVLIFRDLSSVVERWSDQSYTAVGEYLDDGFSSFGLDRKRVLRKIGKSQLAVIDGAGHAYFRKPACSTVFELARQVTAQHADYAGNIKYADEDVMDIVMTILDLKPAPYDDFFTRYLTVKPGTIYMDATIGKCHFISIDTGKRMDPFMMHFAANEAPFPYARQLRALFRKFGVNTSGLYAQAFLDYFDFQIRPKIRRLLSILKLR